MRCRPQVHRHKGSMWSLLLLLGGVAGPAPARDFDVLTVTVRRFEDCVLQASLASIEAYVSGPRTLLSAAPRLPFETEGGSSTDRGRCDREDVAIPGSIYEQLATGGRRLRGCSDRSNRLRLDADPNCRVRLSGCRT